MVLTFGRRRSLKTAEIRAGLFCTSRTALMFSSHPAAWSSEAHGSTPSQHVEAIWYAKYHLGCTCLRPFPYRGETTRTVVLLKPGNISNFCLLLPPSLVTFDLPFPGISYLLSLIHI